MSRLTLPAGQSVRQVAERLGIPVEQLGKHAGVRDVEAPLPAERLIEVPDGFLAERPKKKGDPHYKDVLRPGGMNSVLALDVEYRRTRVAGGMKAHSAKPEELDGLAEAARAYLRFEAESNELAAKLYHPLVQSPSVDVRAAASAGEALAMAQRYHRFGEPAARARLQAISSAQAATMADPKLPEAHLAMGLGLAIEPASSVEAAQALRELERACELGGGAHAWAELALLLHRAADPEAAAVADKALELGPADAIVLEAAALIAPERRLELLRRAVDSLPTYANAAARLARALREIGSAEAQVMEQKALERALTEPHVDLIRKILAG